MEAAQAQCSDKTKILLDLMMAARLQHYVNIAGVQDLQFNAVPVGFFTKGGERVKSTQHFPLWEGVKNVSVVFTFRL